MDLEPLPVDGPAGHEEELFLRTSTICTQALLLTQMQGAQLWQQILLFDAKKEPIPEHQLHQFLSLDHMVSLTWLS